jgi:HSP90 family molecular chaperone
MKKGFILIFLFFPFVMQAQQMKITGTAYDADTRNKLKLVFVNNLTQREVDHTGQKGDFELTAELGDLIVFSCPGYQNDTLVLENMRPKLVLMKPSIIVLNEVMVSAKAKVPEDVRSAYSSAYSYANTNILSQDGKVSLGNAFSKQSQQKRAFRKFMDSELDETLIDKEKEAEVVDPKTNQTRSDMIKEMFEKSLDKKGLTIRIEALKGEGSPPAMVLLPESARRMQEMMAMMQNQSVQFPMEHTLMVNTAHPMIQNLVSLNQGAIVTGSGESPSATLSKQICEYVYDLALMGQKGFDADGIRIVYGAIESYVE